jgi:hypothetical protein
MLYRHPVLAKSLSMIAPFAVMLYAIYSQIRSGTGPLGSVTTYLRECLTAQITVPAAHKLNKPIKKFMLAQGIADSAKGVTLEAQFYEIRFCSNKPDDDDEPPENASYEFQPDAGSYVIPFQSHRLTFTIVNLDLASEKY